MSTFDHTSLIQGINESLATFRKAQPDAMRGFAQLAQASMAEGALTSKHKELIALAIGVTQRCSGCIGFHVKALQKLGAWETLSPKLAPAEDVRGALALVERNEAPLGIVYGSDAVASKGVKVVGTFPEASHQKVEYPLAIVDGHRNAAVSAFYDYLKGPEASAIFQRYGFTTR